MRQDLRPPGQGYGNHRPPDGAAPGRGMNFGRGGMQQQQQVLPPAPGGFAAGPGRGGRGGAYPQPGGEGQWGGAMPGGAQGQGGRFTAGHAGGRGDPAWRGRGGRFIPRGGPPGSAGGRGAVAPGRGRGWVAGRGRGYEGQHPDAGRGGRHAQQQQQQPRRNPGGDDPTLLLRRKQSRAARLSRQVAPLKVSAQLAGSKLYDRWAAAVSAGGNAVDGSDGTSPPQPYLSHVLATTSDAAFLLPLDVAEQRAALVTAPTAGVPPGCSLVASKFGSFLLPSQHAAALGPLRPQ